MPIVVYSSLNCTISASLLLKPVILPKEIQFLKQAFILRHLIPTPSLFPQTPRHVVLARDPTKLLRQ